MSQNYSDLVSQAEKAVGAVKDPELKRIAFQKVLDDLLNVAPKTKTASINGEPINKKVPKSKRASSGTTGYIKALANDGFFIKPKTISQIKAELENQGRHIPLNALSTPLQRLCQAKILRRQKLKAPGQKQTFAYSNW